VRTAIRGRPSRRSRWTHRRRGLPWAWAYLPEPARHRRLL